MHQCTWWWRGSFYSAWQRSVFTQRKTQLACCFCVFFFQRQLYTPSVHTLPSLLPGCVSFLSAAIYRSLFNLDGWNNPFVPYRQRRTRTAEDVRRFVCLRPYARARLWQIHGDCVGPEWVSCRRWWTMKGRFYRLHPMNAWQANGQTDYLCNVLSHFLPVSKCWDSSINRTVPSQPLSPLGFLRGFFICSQFIVYVYTKVRIRFFWELSNLIRPSGVGVKNM